MRTDSLKIGLNPPPATMLFFWAGMNTDEVEDPIEEALSASGLGEVTGGSGTHVGIEVKSETDIAEAVALLKRVLILRELKVPLETTIAQYALEEEDKIFRVCN